MNTHKKKLQYGVAVLAALALVFYIGFYTGGKQRPTSLTNPQATDGNYVSSEQFASFWKAWQILNQDHVNNASTSLDSRVWGAIQGLASAYGDPYTVFFPPKEAKLFKENIAGNFGGVGMEVGQKNGQLVVISPIKDSPAEKLGVKAGDTILAINGTSTAGMAVDVAVGFIRGEVGTPVKITFQTGTAKPAEKTIVRAVINIPTIDTSKKPGGIFVIRLYSFTANSADLFRNALREFVLSGDHKLVLDLRGNPGGYLDAAWDMASYFLPAGKVIVTEDFGKNKMPTIYRSKGYNVFNDKLQMEILVDGGSASASEILAGALKEQGIAKLVGAKTFGKGSVQELVPITDNTSLKVTIARWLTPQGHNLSHDGLEPDYPVTVTEADAKAGIDAQMNKALDLLKAQP